MRTPLALLEFLAKALLNAFTGGLVTHAAEFVVDVLPAVAHDVHDWWSASASEAERRAQLAALAQADRATIHEAAVEIVARVAGDQPAEVRRALTAYLTHVPPTIRRTLRRPADPSGTTVPASLSLRRAEDLLPLLPARLPRFQPGDRPLPHADRELIELLGVGGFGEVWKARAPDHRDGWVALKICLDSKAKQLWRHEADLLRRVLRQGRHPGIVPLLNTYLYDDPPCLEYEHVAGGDLAGLLQEWHRQPPAPRRLVLDAARLVRDLAEAVAFAHRLEPPIVHRDLKPANILVQRQQDGTLRPRVTDFGIGGVGAGRALAESRSGGGRPVLLTALRGAHTPLYASPQQVRGALPDPRDDVYALGVIWHQLLTGDLTSGRPGGTRWLRRLADLGMSQELCELLGACFEDSPADRPPDATVLTEELTTALERALPVPATARPLPLSSPHIGVLRQYQGHTAAVEAVAFSSDGKRLASAGADQTVRLWDLDDARQLKEIHEQRRWPLAVAFSPDGHQLAGGGWGRVLRLWDAETGWERQFFQGHKTRLLAVAWTPDGRHVLSGGADCTLRSWRVETGEPVRCWRCPDDLNWSSVAFSRDGRRAISGSAERTVRLWDLETGRELHSLPGHTGPVLSVALSSDGRRALTGGHDPVARLWDVDSGRELGRLEGHTNWIWSLAFSPDGRRALSGSSDRTVRLWDLAKARELIRLDGHDKTVQAVAFTPDGKRGLSGGSDQRLCLWGLPE